MREFDQDFLVLSDGLGGAMPFLKPKKRREGFGSRIVLRFVARRA